MTEAIPADWAARGFNHIGDVDVAGRYVYAPYEQPDYERGEQASEIPHSSPFQNRRSRAAFIGSQRQRLTVPSEV